MLVTGCRPSEAAYVVFNKSIAPNDFKHLPSKWKATAPADFTKTHIKYKWLIPNEENGIVEMIRGLKDTGYDSHGVLNERLKYWFRKVRKDANVAPENNLGQSLNMRSVRCHHATEWVKLDAEFKFMTWPSPPNPLQHETPVTTLRCYAEKQSDDREEAIKRCLVKWPEDAKKRLKPRQEIDDIQNNSPYTFMIDTSE